MIKNQGGVKMTVDHLARVAAAIAMLRETRVMVGLPSETAGRREGGITNAALGYIHEHGAPEAKIPARPWLHPGVKQAESTTTTLLKTAGELALAGKGDGALRAMNVAGLQAVSAVRRYLTAGVPPPLAASTVRRRRRRSKGSSYLRVATSPSQTTPLVDTGQLRQAVTYVVRRVR